MSEPIVEIEQGKLKGDILKDVNGNSYYTFKSIPYATPPVGKLRFSAPQPPTPWEGVRDSTKGCNICAQFDQTSNKVVGDEDCLYLNVSTPKLPSEVSSLLPVMFYIHGGGFVYGNGTDPAQHGPEFLIGKDVVIVIINYRVGVLGFLTLDCKEAPGNVGLKDQVLALKWVQKNIRKFNGDPKNVTIFGISAGGASVEYLLLSPMAKDLFHKAIAQSGSSLSHWANNDRNKVKALAIKMASVNGKVFSDLDELLKYLKDLPINDLISVSMSVLKADEFKGGIHFAFVPTVEKSGDWEPFLTKSSYELLAKGEFSKVPFMTGICEREGLLTVSHGLAILNKLKEEKNFVDHFPFDLDSVEKTDIEKRLKSIYLEGSKKSKEADAFAIDFFTDVDMLGGIYVAAMLLARHISPVYFYEFSYDGVLNYVKKVHNIDREGACHGDDGGYLLKCDKLTGKLSDDDVFVRNMMVELWTNFAKYGNPTPKTNDLITTKWEPISETGPACLVIDKKLSMKYEIYPERTKLYQEMYEKKFGSK